MEIKRAIIMCLKKRYPFGYTESGMSVTCFKNKTGADGQPLIGIGGASDLVNSLDDLVGKGEVISYGEYKHGQKTFHYKTDVRPPVVGRMEEIKSAILKCLHENPNGLTCDGIEAKCFKTGFGNSLKGDDGQPLVGLGDAATIQRSLDELAVEDKIDAREQERDGKQVVHYVGKPDRSVTPPVS